MIDDPCDPGYAERDYHVPDNDPAPQHPARSLEEPHDENGQSVVRRSTVGQDNST